MENKFAGELGIKKLYATLLDAAGVDYELVYTTDRFSFRFDPDFDSWNYLSENMFYFPETDKYLAPIDFSLPYGYAPFEWTGNYGLFIDKKDGEIVSNTDFIPFSGLEETQSNIQSTITFEDDFSTVNVHQVQTQNGYRGQLLRYVYNLAPVDERDGFFEDNLQIIGPDASCSELEVLNTSEEDGYENRFIEFGCKMTVNSLIEKAGNRFLFNIGDVIGPQNELYQDKERLNDVEFHHKMIYDRKITFTIPDGYRLKNPEDANINIVVNEGGGEVAGFKSSFTQDGNVVTVDVYEFYDRVYFPKRDFEEFRKVVNAAADFNKVVYVFEPI